MQPSIRFAAALRKGRFDRLRSQASAGPCRRACHRPSGCPLPTLAQGWRQRSGTRAPASAPGSERGRIGGQRNRGTSGGGGRRRQRRLGTGSLARALPPSATLGSHPGSGGERGGGRQASLVGPLGRNQRAFGEPAHLGRGGDLHVLGVHRGGSLGRALAGRGAPLHSRLLAGRRRLLSHVGKPLRPWQCAGRVTGSALAALEGCSSGGAVQRAGRATQSNGNVGQ